MYWSAQVVPAYIGFWMWSAEQTLPDPFNRLYWHDKLYAVWKHAAITVAPAETLCKSPVTVACLEGFVTDTRRMGENEAPNGAISTSSRTGHGRHLLLSARPFLSRRLVQLRANRVAKQDTGA